MRRQSTKKDVSAAALAALALSGAPAANAELVYGITGSSAGSSLISFDSSNPGGATVIGSLSGVLAGHTVRGIDFRPATGELYAVSNNGTAGQVYTVNLATGALTPVGAGFTFPTAPGVRISIDFNPVVDRIRLIDAATQQNLRLNPVTGGLAGTDTLSAYDAGDVNFNSNPPFLVGAAYSNNFAGATSTTMYVWDFDLDVLATQGGVGGVPSPNTGLLFTVGGPSTFITDDGGVGFDISSTTGIGYFSYRNLGVETFATMNLGTGVPTDIGTFGTLDVLDISVVIPTPGSAGLVALAGLAALRRRRA